MPPALVEERETEVREVRQLGETSTQRVAGGQGQWALKPGRLRSHHSEQLLRHSRLGLALQLPPGTVTDLGITPCCHLSCIFIPSTPQIEQTHPEPRLSTGYCNQVPSTRKEPME